jgi:hypothetical protein
VSVPEMPQAQESASSASVPVGQQTEVGLVMNQASAPGSAEEMLVEDGEEAMVPATPYIDRLLRGAGIAVDGPVFCEWREILRQAGFHSPELLEHARGRTLPADWPLLLQYLIAAQLGDEGVIATGSSARKRLRSIGADSDSDDDRNSQGKVILVSRVVLNTDGMRVPVMDKGSAHVSERDQRPCFRLMSRARYEVLLPQSSMDVDHVLRVVEGYETLGSAVGEVSSDFDSCSGFWMIRSLPVVTDHEKLSAALRMRFSENGPAKGKRLRLSDFSEEASWSKHVGKEATTRGEGLILRALEGLQKFLVVFFGSAYKDCLGLFAMSSLGWVSRW